MKHAQDRDILCRASPQDLFPLYSVSLGQGKGNYLLKVHSDFSRIPDSHRCEVQGRKKQGKKCGHTL